MSGTKRRRKAAKSDSEDEFQPAENTPSPKKSKRVTSKPAITCSPRDYSESTLLDFEDSSDSGREDKFHLPFIPRSDPFQSPIAKGAHQRKHYDICADCGRNHSGMVNCSTCVGKHSLIGNWDGINSRK